MSDESNAIPSSKCRQCQKTIFWHKSRAGKNYPCDSETDRRAFHECTESAKPAPTNDSLDATLIERVACLEKQVSQLVRAIQAVAARQPIAADDVGF